jgi:hypothetical protein
MTDDLDLDELAAELADFDTPQKAGGRTAREERIIAGFEDVQRFVEQHGRPPLYGEDRDIFERLYAVRLDRLRTLEECRALLASIDHQGLLGEGGSSSPAAETMDEDELMAELEGFEGADDITDLRHVRTTADRRAAEEIANRDPCDDFDQFKPLFEKVAQDIESGARVTRRIRKDAGFLKTDIKQGEFFILGGQTLYIAEVGEPIRAPNGQFDARMRVVYSNGTESNLLLRSLQRALYKDDTSRRVSEPTAGPLFAESDAEDEDLASGTIYVLRSQSSHPLVAQHREILHKIGVTGGDVARRVANAKLDPTFLMADVEVVATYQLFNISRVRLEAIIHRVFEPARLDIEIMDRFGHPVVPREWFLVPTFVVNEAVERIKDGTITRYVYDPSKAKLVKDASAR